MQPMCFVWLSNSIREVKTFPERDPLLKAFVSLRSLLDLPKYQLTKQLWDDQLVLSKWKISAATLTKLVHQKCLPPSSAKVPALSILVAHILVMGLSSAKLLCIMHVANMSKVLQYVFAWGLDIAE